MRKIESYRLAGTMTGMTRMRDGALVGYIHTPFGTVGVQMYRPTEGGAIAYFGFAHRGRVYYAEREKAKPFTVRGLAIIAGRFAAEVAAQATNRGRHG